MSIQKPVHVSKSLPILNRISNSLPAPISISYAPVQHGTIKEHRLQEGPQLVVHFTEHQVPVLAAPNHHTWVAQNNQFWLHQTTILGLFQTKRVCF